MARLSYPALALTLLSTTALAAPPQPPTNLPSLAQHHASDRITTPHLDPRSPSTGRTQFLNTVRARPFYRAHHSEDRITNSRVEKREVHIVARAAEADAEAEAEAATGRTKFLESVRGRWWYKERKQQRDGGRGHGHRKGEKAGEHATESAGDDEGNGADEGGKDE